MNNRTLSVVIRSFVHIMSLDKFRANCPYFSVGNCISYKEGKCKYEPVHLFSDVMNDKRQTKMDRRKKGNKRMGKIKENAKINYEEMKL